MNITYSAPIMNDTPADSCGAILCPTDSLLERLHLIPDELTACPQWLVWRSVARGTGKPTKVPYDAGHPFRRGKVNDSATWQTFDVTVSAFADALATSRPFAGIGFVFTAGDPFVGVDLDDCLSGDALHPAAREIVEAMGSYAEVSPSMTGVKIWTRGRLGTHKTGLQGRGPWGGKIEIYRERRWFAVTGWRLT